MNANPPDDRNTAPPPNDAPDDDNEMPLPKNPQTIFLGGLFLIACLVIAYVAQDILIPIVIAIVLKLLLQPLVRLLERIHIPRALGALVAVLVLLGVVALLAGILSGPATKMVENMPALTAKLQERFSALQSLLERLRPFLGRIGVDARNPAEMIHVDPGSVAGSVAAGASSFASHFFETLLILYYMLVFGETFMRRLVEILPRFGDKKQAVAIATTVERDISAYLLTITIINTVVGVLAGIVMALFGIPGAVVWGVIAFILNYIPILGPMAGVVLFAIVGLATIGAAWTALLPAVCYLAIHVAEGEVITPMLLARRFTLNPIVVILGLIAANWMWGVQGAVLSVPFLAIVKIISDRLRPLKALGHLLEG